jgi:glycosyltransferase involved in cell wall biosynthesis
MNKKYVLAINAINIRAGGGVTHLSRLLHAAEPMVDGLWNIHIWTCRETASKLPDRNWLTIHTPFWAESNLLVRTLAQQVWLPVVVKRFGCNILYCPGGTLPAIRNIPVITMSQNMLPFEPDEARRFGIGSPMWLKLQILRYIQGRAFRRADGLVFLTNYAREVVTRALGRIAPHIALVPHGIEERFLIPPRIPRLLSECSTQNPFRVLYVSILMPYKHQLEVAQAAALLRNKGLPIEMCFIGASWGEYGKRFGELLKQLDSSGQYLKWLGHEPFESVHKMYGEADAFIFASSCENLPNIMIEAMAASLPIASSRKGPMPEVLGDAGIYFDPECPNSIAECIEKLAKDSDLRTDLSLRAHNLAKTYSWRRCASQSLEFFVNVARMTGE